MAQKMDAYEEIMNYLCLNKEKPSCYEFSLAVMAVLFAPVLVPIYAWLRHKELIWFSRVRESAVEACLPKTLPRHASFWLDRDEKGNLGRLSSFFCQKLAFFLSFFRFKRDKTFWDISRINSGIFLYITNMILYVLFECIWNHLGIYMTHNLRIA